MKRLKLTAYWSARVVGWVLIAAWFVPAFVASVFITGPMSALFELDDDAQRAIRDLNEGDPC